MKTMMLLVLLIAMPVVLGAQVPSLNLVADKEAYVVGDPVVVYVTVTNTSDKVAEAPILFGPEYDVYTYTIQGPDGKPVRFAPLMVKETYVPNASLERGQQVSGSARIFFGAQGYSFLNPGLYAIRCTYGSQTSNELVLK
jgi:hypothetical protein